MQFILAQADPLEHVLPHPIFGHHLTWFSNQSVMVLLGSLLMIWMFAALFSRPDSNAPSGFKNLLETILQFMRDEVFKPALKEHTDVFLPFLWTIFFFILIGNLFGCFPLSEILDIGSGGHIKHIGGSFTGSINTTATLAVVSFFYIHFHGIGVLFRSLVNGTYGHHHGHEGPGDFHAPDGTEAPHPHLHKMSPAEAAVKVVPVYLWNFAPHPFKDKSMLIDVPMWAFLLCMELLGAIIKPFALCMRLFGNMVSGHMVLAVLVGLIVASAPTFIGQSAVGIPIMLLDLLIQFLEILVAFLQAYIFAFLVALFIAGAVAPEH